MQNEFEVAKHHEIETKLTLKRFCMKFLDLLDFFLNPQALATLLLQTIGSKRVAKTQTMENNGSKVPSASESSHKTISRLLIIMKSKHENFVQNGFEVAKHHEIETELTLKRFCTKFLDLLDFFKSAGPCYPLATEQ